MMRSIGRIGLLCAALVALSLVGASATAAKKAKKHHVTTQIALEAVGPDGISGRVSAQGKACRAQRQVAVYRINSGPSVPSNEFVTSTWTRGDGSWALPGPQYPGQYWAEVVKKTVPKTKAEPAKICRQAFSDGATWG